MPIPSSGPYTSNTIKDEWSYSFPFTSSQVATSTSLSNPWTSEQLRGKSAVTVSITATSSEQVVTGSFRKTVYNASLNITGGTPTSYSWSASGPMGTLVGSSTSSTATFEGEVYDSYSATSNSTEEIYCSVVIGGATYSPTYETEYTTN